MQLHNAYAVTQKLMFSGTRL